MNDFELESKLKSVPVPSRTGEYWDTFPSRVRSQLRPVFVRRSQRNFLPRFAWDGAIAFACLIFVLAIWPVFRVALKDQNMVRRELSQLPHQLRVLMADEHGMHYLVADQP